MSAPSGGYQGLGYYSEPPPEKKKPRGLLLSLAVATLVVVGLVVTLLVVSPTSPMSGQPLAIPGVSPKTSATPARPGSTSSSNSGDPLQPKATGAPQVAGWKVIPINDGKQLQTSKAYDVPPSWEPLTISAAFGPDDIRVELYTPAIYLKGYCTGSPTSFRAMAGLMTVPNTGDNATQAVTAAQRITEAVFHTKNNVKPKVAMGQPQPISVDRDKKGYTVSAKSDITLGPDDKCTPTKAAVNVVVLESKPADKTSVVIASFADQDFAEAVPEQYLQQIVTSMHAAN